ncbi:hypothetical protein LX16_5231 [Stackebrandtia albiflava]|uniref:Small secreted protein n=1 Tax=Stackebrandtia albiflava TaxID=406432 RepID=A0A562ULK2_9ACTN|nr:hypothetical protein [Stackebrandtia albiflava]TWJ06494.1 hypothetical protein LX16_5231 [Stackebrandtia albiflava]
MARFATRMLTAAASGAIAVAAFTGCSQVNAAVDCATVADTMMEVSTNVTGDPETLKTSTEKLRTQAEDIEDQALKQSAIDFADQADELNAVLNGDISADISADPTALQDSLDAFTQQCGV